MVTVDIINNLFDAIYEGDITFVKKTLINNSDIINYKNDYGQTPLHRAAFCGKAKIVGFLILSGANVNIKDNQGYTPLHEAIYSENFKCANHLLLMGADINAKAEGGYEVTPLSLLAQLKVNNLLNHNDNQVIDKINKLLITQGALIFSIPVAAVFGTISDIERLLNIGIDINDSLHPSGWTALHVAVIQGNIELAKHLINRGADINYTDEDHKTPLEYASTEDFYRYLRDNKAETYDEIWDDIYSGVESTNQIRFGLISGDRLFEAVKCGDLDSVKNVMSLSVDDGGLLLLRLIAKDFQGNSPLHIAAEKGHKEIVIYLLEKGIADHKNNYGKTAKDLADERGFIDIVTILKKSQLKQ
jgi:ankyrin repeat protein